MHLFYVNAPYEILLLGLPVYANDLVIRYPWLIDMILLIYAGKFSAN
jgi:hypothetical protein